MTDPLPTSAEVRCRLALDLRLQIHGLFELAKLRGRDELGFFKNVREARDRRLIDRLQDVVPAEELTRAASGERLDLDALMSRVPAVNAIWVMITALAVQDAAKVVERARDESDE